MLDARLASSSLGHHSAQRETTCGGWCGEVDGVAKATSGMEKQWSWVGLVWLRAWGTTHTQRSIDANGQNYNETETTEKLLLLRKKKKEGEKEEEAGNLCHPQMPANPDGSHCILRL